LTWVVKTRAARSALMAASVGASSPRSRTRRRGLPGSAGSGGGFDVAPASEEVDSV
jgi:hypothetical protein